MAIEVISNPSMTYQGSVSGAEISQGDIEKVTGRNAKELTDNEQREDTISVQEQNADNGRNKETTVVSGTEAMKKAVEEINRNAKNSEAIFGIHDATNRITIKIVDKDTKKVIKEYPPEKTLDMIAKVWEMAGLMVDEKR